jgi:signal transduction histidine kinase
MDGRNRRTVALTLLALAVAISAAASASWLAMRWILRQDVRDSAQAQTVIAVSKLRAQGERFVGRARAFLLSGDRQVLERLQGDRGVFLASLDRLVSSGGPGHSGAIAPLRAAAYEYSAALDTAIAARPAAPSDLVMAHENRLRTLRAGLEAAFDDLLEREEAELRSVDGSSREVASSITALASAVALGALAIAVALGLWLMKTFHSLAQKGVALEAAKARLEAANRDLEAFAARVAHDVRTPLTPISLLAAQLQRSSQDARVVGAASRIRVCVERASAMVESLLTFSRIGGLITDTAHTAAAKSVSDTLEDFADEIERERITLKVDLDPAATAACAPALFREIVGNLVSNSLKFLRQVETRRLSVLVRRRSGAVEVEVADSGPGIPVDAQARIFEPFHRVAGTGTPGSGIGLATVRRIVDAYHGSVTVLSQPGAGATFCVRLPGIDRETGGPLLPPALSSRAITS